MVAAHHGFLETVTWFMEKEADVNTVDNFGQNVLWYCLGGTQRHTEIVEILLKNGVKIDCNVIGKPLLVRACEKGNKATDVVQLLINRGADVNEVAIRSGRTALVEAARRGAVKVVDMLLAEKAFVDMVDCREVTGTQG